MVGVETSGGREVEGTLEAPRERKASGELDPTEFAVGTVVDAPAPRALAEPVLAMQERIDQLGDQLRELEHKMAVLRARLNR